MGYSHYWSFNFKAGKAADLEAAYQKAILECQKLVSSIAKENRSTWGTSQLSGYTAHTKPGSYSGLLINGSAGNEGEPFIMREHFKFNDPSGWCKTNRRYYDEVVKACLLILKYRLKDAMRISSDGILDDWQEAAALASKSIRRKVQVPDTIKRSYEERRRA